MFRKFLLIFLLLLISLSNSFSISKPSIVWEKSYEFDSLTGIWLYSFAVFDHEIVSWVEGMNIKSKPNSAFAFVKTDLNGNLLVSKEYTREDQSMMRNFQFKKNSNGYTLQGLWMYPKQGGYPFRIFHYEIDESGNLNNTIPDSTKDSSYFNAYPNFIYDSIYVALPYAKFLTDIYQYEYKHLLHIYDNNYNFVRELFLDTTGLGMPIQSKTSLSYIYPTKEKNILVAFTDTLNFKEHPYGTVKYDLFCKFNLSGKLIWKCKLDQPGSNRFFIRQSYITKDNCYFVQGQLFKQEEPFLYFAKINFDGQLIWSKLVKFSDNVLVTPENMKPIKNGDYYAVYGWNHVEVEDKDEAKQFWMTIVDSNANVIEEHLWNTDITDNSINGIQELENGNLMIMGRDGWNKFYLAEMTPDYITDVEDIVSNEKYFNVECTPSPAKDFIKISIKFSFDNYRFHCQLVNLNGEVLKEFEMAGDFILDTMDLIPGSYLIKISCLNSNSKAVKNITKKINIIK
jgi:hypothetical protein